MVLAHLKYFGYVLKHKWFVFLAGKKFGISYWQLLIHDFTKFSRAEWTPYVNRFYRGIEDKSQFYKALMHHYENNPHHWNYWVDSVMDRPFPMPNKYIAEMVADWMGAGRAKTGSWDIVDWYCKHKNRMNMHPHTRKMVESLIPGYSEAYNEAD